MRSSDFVSNLASRFSIERRAIEDHVEFNLAVGFCDDLFLKLPVTNERQDLAFNGKLFVSYGKA